MKGITNNIAFTLIFLSFFISAETKAFLFGDDKPVAVTVNGAKIYEETLTKIAKARYEETEKSNASFTLADARGVVLGEMIMTEVILQEGRKKIIWVNDKEVHDFINKAEGFPYEDLKKQENYKGDFIEFEKSIKAQITYQKLLLKEYAKKIEPNEEQMKAYYREHIREFQNDVPEQYSLKIINIWPFEDCKDPKQARLLARNRANEIVQKLKNGEDFDELDKIEIAEHQQRVVQGVDIDPNKAQRYSLKDMNDPYVITMKKAQKKMDEFRKTLPKVKRNEILQWTESGIQSEGPEFAKAVLSLKPGEFSDVIDTKKCFCIVKFLEKIDGKTSTISYENAKEKIRKYVSNKLLEEVYYSHLQKVMKEADIKFTNPTDDWRLKDKK